MTQGTPQSIWSLVALSLAMSGCGAGLSTTPAGSQESATPTPHASGELLLKLQPALGARLEQALAATRSPTQTGLAWLDALNRRYGVTKIEPIFANPPDLEAIRRKYPERARRAPPDAAIPTLAHLYRLTLRRDADVLQAAADYAARPEVEYAQPNYLAHTLSPDARRP